jgi:hypothetical protein
MFTYPVGFYGDNKDFPKVESTYNTRTNSSSITVNFPSGYSVGDRIVICISAYGNTTVNTPSGWDNVVGQKNSLATLEVFSKILTGSEGSSVTISLSVGTYVCANAYRISGADTIEGTLVVKDGTANINPPSETASWGVDKNLWLVAGAGYSYTYTNTAPTNYNNNFIDNPYSSGGIDWTHLATGTREYEIDTENPGTFGGSLSGGYDWVAATLVVKPK